METFFVRPRWLVHRRVTPSIKLAGTHLYTWVKRGTARVKCLAQEHNTMIQPGLEPGQVDLESSALTVRPPCLPQSVVSVFICLRSSHISIVSYLLINPRTLSEALIYTCITNLLRIITTQCTSTLLNLHCINKLIPCTVVWSIIL